MVLGIKAASQQMGAMIPIQTLTADGTWGRATFTNIPNTFQDLIVIANFRGGFASTIVSSYGLINDRLVSEYDNIIAGGNGSSLQWGREATNVLRYATQMPGGNSASNARGALYVQFMNYADTTKWKCIVSRFGNDQNGSGWTGYYLNTWRNTSAINQIAITTDGEAIIPSGCTFELYGIRKVGQ